MSEIWRATRMSAIGDVDNVVASHSFVSVTLLDDLDAFYQEHERCGELDSAVDATASG